MTLSGVYFPRMLSTEIDSFSDVVGDELADEMMNRHVEVQTLADLLGTDNQRSTPIPALYNVFYKFLQNPSTVSVETYKRMVDTDETVGSGLDFLVSCLVARLGPYQHKDPEITAFVNKALAEMKGGPVNTFKEMLSASWAGFSVSEIVWANKEIGFVPEKLVTMPPGSILFSANRNGELESDGILQYQRNYNPLAMSSNIAGGFYSAGGVNGFAPNRPDPMAKLGDFAFPVRLPNSFSYMSIRIPVLKCVHFTWNSQGCFGNPYGRSLLRRAYNWWIQKWAYAQMMGVALDRKGTPLTVVFADPNVSVVDQNKMASGSKSNTRDSMLRGPAAAAAAFKNIHNDSVVVLPGKKGQNFDIEKLDVSSNAQDFIGSIQLCNTLIMRALLIPALVFSSGDGAGSYALGAAHEKTFDKICDGYLEGFKNVLVEQVVQQILAYNYPAERWKLDGAGGFAKRELTMDEREKEMNVFTAAIDKGIVDANDLADLNKMREAIGFEPRTEVIKKPKPMMPMMGVDGDGDKIQSDGTEDESDGTDDGSADPSVDGNGGSGTRPGFGGTATKPKQDQTT